MSYITSLPCNGQTMIFSWTTSTFTSDHKHYRKTEKPDIDKYRLTSLEEPTDEMLEQMSG